MINVFRIIIINLLCVSVAYTIELQDIELKTIDGDRAQVLLKFSDDVTDYDSFSIDNPAKIVFDFPKVVNKVHSSKSNQNTTLGVLNAVNVIDSADKSRLILDVINIVPHTSIKEGNNLVITLENEISRTVKNIKNNNIINSVDFRRGSNNEGRIVIGLSAELASIDFQEDNRDILVKFSGGTIDEELLRNYDVTDFGTPISKFSIFKDDNGISLRVEAQGEIDRMAYQLDDQYIIEVKPLSTFDISSLNKRKEKFSGEKISLNFQDIEVRAVLQLMADFTGLNIVTSDTVQGNVTLRLENVPWDQALDFILKSKGLGKREEGNVLLIAPNEEITAREQLELEALQQTESIAPLVSEYVQVNYAKAADMVSLLKDSENSIVSDRGQVTVDERTNTLLIRDTADNLEEVKSLLAKLDVPVRQVLIEAFIVQTKDNLEDKLGVKLGGATKLQLGKYPLGIANTAERAATIATNNAVSSDESGFFFDLANNTGLGALGLSLGKLPGGTLLNLELRASELESLSKTIARPKLMTLDQQTASIETGTDLPFTTTSTDGATPTTTFRKATIKLDVTPQITPNDKIIMELVVAQDKPGETINGQTAIDTTNVSTNVLVGNGETVVLGGIFQDDNTKSVSSIPFFSDLPVVGKMFQNNVYTENRSEVLIFVTPKIIGESN